MSQSRQLAAIMFTDIVGYTALMGEDSAKALEIVRISREIQKPLVELYNGRWLKDMGDGALISFNSALDAVNCSIEIQQSATSKLSAKLRIGIHLGDITIEENDVYGDGVNVASRLESIADPGGIYISDNIEKSIKGQTNVQVKYLGEISLKNVAYTVRTYALQGESLPVPKIKEKKEISGRFLAMVQRRGLIRVVITYLTFSLFLILLLPYVNSVIEIPVWLSNLLYTLLVVGFPLAMYLAWNYEWSPEGIVRTNSVQSWQNPKEIDQRKPLTSNFIISLLILLSATLYLYPRIPGVSNEKLDSEITDKSIAVLPFSDLSPTGDQKYLADGVQEAILNHLAKIKDMRVISRNTMEMYRQSNKSTPSIANEVGVSYVLEGSVQRITDKVRITVLLIEGNSDRQMWSENFDKDLTDIFAIQTEIAKNVANVLKATLTGEERRIIESIPTSNLTAYDYYLKGMDYKNRSNYEEDIRFAAQMFKQAIQIDSTFALAWVGLASTSRSAYWFRFDRTEENLAQTKKYLEKAKAYGPDLMEVQLETAKYYYHCEANYPKALQILERLRSEYPNNAQLHSYPGYIYRRMGAFEKSFEYLDRAISLNPSSWEEWTTAGVILVYLRRYNEAEDYFKTAIDLNPSRDRGYSYLVELSLITGNIRQARANLPKSSTDYPWMHVLACRTELLDRNYDEAIRIMESSPNDVFVNEDEYRSKSMLLGLIYYKMTSMEKATSHFQDTRQHLENKLKESPEDSRLHSALGIVYAGLGMKEEGVISGNKALSIINISVDAVEGYYRELDMARILSMTGKYDEAIAKLEFLIQRNGLLSVELLKRDPFWNPLREIGAFKDLIASTKSL